MIEPVPVSPSAAKAAYVELDASAVRHNASVFRSLVGASALGFVLKGNAYGHGFERMLPLVHPEAAWLYVISPWDAVAIRAFEAKTQAPARRLLVTGALSGEEAAELSREQVEMTLADPSWHATAMHLRARGLRARVHVFLDSGLGREGFREAEVADLLDLLERNQDVLEPVGALSHFSNTEDVTEQSYAREQMAAFERGCARLSEHFPQVRWMRHFAASAATLVLPDARYDAVRVGISLYGLWPSAETKVSMRVVLGAGTGVKLLPVMSVRCESQSVKWLEEGSYIGYGCTYRCDQRTRVAVLPVGYFDGYPRLVSGKAHVLVHGQRCRVLGRVMMNHLVVDVTQVRDGAETLTATLLGRDGAESVTAEMLADWAQTISYEVVTGFGAHLRRVVTSP